MKNFIAKRLLCAMIVLLLFAAKSFPQIPKPLKNTYVNDYAGVLTKAQIKELNVQIHKLERVANIQLAIVLVNKLPKQYEIEDYSLLIARKWHVGLNQRGLVYVAAIKQRKQRLEVSRNLDTVFNDGVNSEILDGIKPYFRQADYHGGLLSMVSAITSAGKPVLVQPVQPIVSGTASTKNDDNSFKIVLYLLCAIPGYYICKLIVLLIMAIINRNKPQSPPNYYNDQPGYRGGYGQPYGGGGGRPSSGLGAGVGGFIAGAATGYAARTLQDHLHDDNNRNHQQNQDVYTQSPVYEAPISNDDNDSSDYGNWGSRSSGSSNSSSSSSSSSSGGYSGSGTTSDW